MPELACRARNTLAELNMEVWLRAVEPEDAELMWLAENDGTSLDSSDYVAPLSRHRVLEYALGYDADPFRAGQLRLMVEVGQDESDNERTAVGIADLYDISMRDLTAWVGIYVSREWRGRGVGRSVLGALSRMARERLGLYALGAKVGERNHASLRLFSQWERCGIMPVWRRTAHGRESVHLFCLTLA